MGQWLPGGTQIGVVSLNESTLTWSILDSNGNRIDRTFGKKGDLAIAGGDFDGDGISDAAVARIEDGKVKWQVAYGLFNTATVQPVNFNFGSPGDRIFYARAEDSSVDWIGVMRKGAGRSSAARLKNLVTNQIRQYTRMPSFAGTGTRPRAFPVRQTGAADLLGFQVPKSNGTEIRVFTLSGVEVGSALFEGKGDAVAGEYTVSAAGFEVVFQSTAEAGAFNASSGEVNQFTPVGGVLVDEININTMGAAVQNPSSDPGSGNEGGGSGGAVANCSSVVPLPGSHIYKTHGSQHFTDVRRNTIGVVLKVGARGPFPGCVQAVDRSGRVIANLGLYSKGAGWAARYYAGIGCGASTPLNGTAVASRARSNTGSSSIYLNFGGVCYGPIEATQCYNSISC
jgi:hypothetical protein